MVAQKELNLEVEENPPVEDTESKGRKKMRRIKLNHEELTLMKMGIKLIVREDLPPWLRLTLDRVNDYFEDRDYFSVMYITGKKSERKMTLGKLKKEIKDHA